MLGAIIGDIAGSRFEWDNIKSKQFELINEDCHPTDDSIMTLAIARAILASNGDLAKLEQETVKCMQKIGRRYPLAGYGGNFYDWLFEKKTKIFLILGIAFFPYICYKFY